MLKRLEDEDKRMLTIKMCLKYIEDLKSEIKINEWGMENLIKIKKLSKSKNLLNFLNERNYEDIKFVIEDFDEVDT